MSVVSGRLAGIAALAAIMVAGLAPHPVHAQNMPPECFSGGHDVKDACSMAMMLCLFSAKGVASTFDPEVRQSGRNPVLDNCIRDSLKKAGVVTNRPPPTPEQRRAAYRSSVAYNQCIVACIAKYRGPLSTFVTLPLAEQRQRNAANNSCLAACPRPTPLPLP